jgi:hypothetical protein
LRPTFRQRDLQEHGPAFEKIEKDSVIEVFHWRFKFVNKPIQKDETADWQPHIAASFPPFSCDNAQPKMQSDFAFKYSLTDEP